MSHEATNWAISQRGLKPAQKIVLWHLCDCHNPAYGGAFPSQEWLVENCEVSPSQLNEHMKALEERGLISREPRKDPVTKKQMSTRYHLAFERDFHVWRKNPYPENGVGFERETDSGFDGEPTPVLTESRLRKSESNPVKEPVREPVTERASASAEAEASVKVDDDSPKRLKDRFKALEIGHSGTAPWPNLLKSSSDWALRQFIALSPDDRRLAEERRDAYLAACPKIARGDRKGQPDAVPLGIYLRDRKFIDLAAVAPRTVQAHAGPDSVDVAPFGPVWGALRMLPLLDGPADIEIAEDLRDAVRKVFEVHRRRGEHAGRDYLARKGIQLGSRDELIFPADFDAVERRRRQMDHGFPKVMALHKQAESRKAGVACAEAAGLSPLMEAVPVGSATYERWARWHAENFLPFVPDPGAQPVVWFPKGGPEAIEEFERAARSIMSKGNCNEN